MRSRSIIAAAACLAVLGSTSGAQGIRYGPGSGRYEYTVATSGLGAASMGRGGVSDITQRMLVSLAISALGRDSLVVEMTVDSSSGGTGRAGRGGGAINPGTKFERRMTVLGRTRGGAAEVRSVEQLVASFLPVLAAGARVGSVWEDTLALDVAAGQAVPFPVEGKMMRTIRVAADTTFEGQSAWRFETGSRIDLSGLGDAISRGAGGMGNMQIQTEGGGEGTGTFYLSKTGVLLFLTEKQDIAVSVNIAALGQPIPIEASVTRTIKRIR